MCVFRSISIIVDSVKPTFSFRSQDQEPGATVLRSRTMEE